MLKVMLKEGSVFREVERTFPPKSTYKFYKQMVPVGTFLRRINGLIHQNLLNSVLEWNNEDYAKEVVAILRIVITEGMASDLFSYINRDFKEGPEIPFFTTIIRNLYYWAFYICITQTKERTQIAQKVFRDESQKLNEEYEIFEKQ